MRHSEGLHPIWKCYSSVTVSELEDSIETKPVSFIVAFPVAPIVVATPENTVAGETQIFVAVSGITTSGFVIGVENIEALTGNVMVHWIAMVLKT